MGRGRPKKNVTRDYTNKLRLTKNEQEELMLFSRLSGLSKADYIREALELKNSVMRAKYGFQKVDEDAYYEDSEYYEDDYDDEL